MKSLDNGSETCYGSVGSEIRLRGCVIERDNALFSALKENVIQLPRDGPTFYPMGCRRSDVPSSHCGEKGAAIGTNQMPCSIGTTATSLIFSGEDDLIDSCSGIAGKVLRVCRIGSQAHSVALSVHNPNSIGLIVPFLRRVPEPKAAIR